MSEAERLEKRPPTDKHCNGIRRGHTGYCTRPAGWGTDHLGTGRCKLHGGASLRGAESATYKHGGSSRYYPQRLREKVQRAAMDPELTEFRGDLSLLEARLQEVLEGVDAAGPAPSWQSAVDMARQMMSLIRSGKSDAARSRMNALVRLVLDGAEESSRWAEVYAIIEKRGKVIERHQKRQRDMNLMIDAARVNVLMDRLSDAITRHVTDPGILRAIGRDFGNILGPGIEGEA